MKATFYHDLPCLIHDYKDIVLNLHIPSCIWNREEPEPVLDYVFDMASRCDSWTPAIGDIIVTEGEPFIDGVWRIEPVGFKYLGKSTDKDKIGKPLDNDKSV